MSAMMNHLRKERRINKRKQLAEDALEFLGCLAIIAGLIAWAFLGYGLGF